MSKRPFPTDGKSSSCLGGLPAAEAAEAPRRAAVLAQGKEHADWNAERKVRVGGRPDLASEASEKTRAEPWRPTSHQEASARQD